MRKSQHRRRRTARHRNEELVWVNSRKGRIITRAQVSDRPNKGFAVYMTTSGGSAPVTSDLREPESNSKNAGYKCCAVNVERIADQRAAERYVIDEYNKLKSRLRRKRDGLRFGGLAGGQRSAWAGQAQHHRHINGSVSTVCRPAALRCAGLRSGSANRPYLPFCHFFFFASLYTARYVPY